MERLPEHIRKHINTIAEQEREFEARHTTAQRIGHAIAGFVGSAPFIIIHAIWFATWFAFNSVPLSGVKPFDPFPFSLLAIMIAVEGIFLVSFILMRQNRMNRRSEEREHLMLQVLLLAEQEITTLIALERRKSLRDGDTEIAHDREIESFSQPTSVDELTKTIQENLPDR
jgi:uncharacterized membrane protein